MKYVLEVADLILAKDPDKAILSSMDFVIIAEWEKQEIPFEVVLRTIEEQCDLGNEVTSVRDLNPVVKRKYGEWLAAESGQSVTHA